MHAHKLLRAEGLRPGLHDIGHGFGEQFEEPLQRLRLPLPLFCAAVLDLNGVVTETVHERGQDRLKVHRGHQLLANGINQGVDPRKMELVREDLDANFHQILLSDLVLGNGNVTEHFRHHLLDVHLEVHPVQPAQLGDTVSHQQPQRLPLLLTLVRVDNDLVLLHPNPEPHHLLEVLQDERHRVFHITTFPLVIIVLVRQSTLRHLTQEVPEEETPRRVLHTLTHFDKVPEELLARHRFCLHPHSPHSNQQVQTWDNVSSVLDDFVELSWTAPVADFLGEVHFEGQHFCEHLRVELVIVLRRQLGSPELCEHSGCVLQHCLQLARANRLLHQCRVLPHLKTRLLQPFRLLLLSRQLWLRHR
eukprot:Hpha_TRINITY_DN10786_c0_g1::TRINITY_DN10786_c0_g1_i1::g.43704::m.43704